MAETEILQRETSPSLTASSSNLPMVWMDFPAAKASKEALREEIPTLPAVEIPVFVATDRQRITSNKDQSGQTLDSLHFGTGTVRLPLEQKWLDGTDISNRYRNLGWNLDRENPTLRPYIELRGYVAEVNKEAVLQELREKDSAFWTNLRTCVQKNPEHRVYVYTHGFASSGENSVYAAGVLSSQVEAPVVAFSWPSAGRAGLPFPCLFGPNTTRSLFKRDQKTIDDPQVLGDLSTLVASMKRNLPADTKITLVAHSLGNKLLTRYLNTDSKDTVDSVRFLAPDVDKKLFLSAVENISRKSKHVSVYMNPKDRVLGVSSMNNFLELKSGQKLGKSRIAAPEIEFIDYQSIAKPDRIGHYIPFEQFGSIERSGNPLSISNGDQYFFFRRTKIEKNRTK